MSHDNSLMSVEDMSEIPSSNKNTGAGGSKGANLFLARQRLIADMMEQEEAERDSNGGNRWSS